MMTKRHAGLVLGLVLVPCAAGLAAGLWNCSAMTDFDKPLVLPEELACLDDEDCWESGEALHACDLCDTDAHTCVPDGTDSDDDGYYVCERALEEGQADCDDGEYRIYPGRLEEADLLDNDCNGTIDDGVLEARGDEPDLIAKPDSADCAEPCFWSSPRIGWQSPYIHAIWESDESVSGPRQERLRVAQLDVNGTTTLSEQLLILKTGTDTEHGMVEAGIASSHVDDRTTHVAVWIDLLGGRTVDVMGFDFTTEVGTGIERPVQEWPVDQGDLRAVHVDPAHPVIIAHQTQAEYFVAWSGREPTPDPPPDPPPVPLADIYLARFTSNETDGMDIDTSRGTDGLVNLTRTPDEDETARPGLVQAGSGLVVAWLNGAGDAIRIAYMTNYGATAPATGDIRTVPLPGIDTSSPGALRDLVLVRSAADVSRELAYLVFCGPPEGHGANEVWAVSVDLNDFASGADDDVFGTPLRVSDSLDDPSIEASAVWYDRAIGIAWSERRGGHNHVCFRRIADLETSRETSGVLASDEINLSVDAEDDTVNVYGQGPAIVAVDTAAEDRDFVFAVMWWQRQPAGGGEDTGDLYLRLVRPVD